MCLYTMLAKTIDGTEYEWKIPERLTKGNKRKTSLGHAAAKHLLHDIYPTCSVYEEIPIIVEFRKKLFLDFYVPALQLAVEVHGKQHYVFTPLYHKSKLDFLKSIGNDAKKSVWCEINNIQLIVLPYSESADIWKLRLLNKK